jgi:glycosyltransferase involved in cell wall biosynthesis
MKLIIQIPCLNESETLPLTLADLPRQVEGFLSVEWLIIDDGSTDGTSEVASKHGVHHVVRSRTNQGLAKSFLIGLDACLEHGADVIVNTDADNQYNGHDICKLVQPVVSGQAEVAIGARPIKSIKHFSPLKKFLQGLGSMVVRKVSNTDILDAPSGFRAISRKAAMQLNVYNEYTYTLETIIQSGQKNLPMISVPIRVNVELRKSRLFKSIGSYIQKSVFTMIRIFVVYRPFRFFMSIATILMGMGFLLGSRFLYYYFTDGGEGHIQSLVLTSLLITIGFQSVVIAFVADLLSVNRKLMEDVQFRVKSIQYKRQANSS